MNKEQFNINKPKHFKCHFKKCPKPNANGLSVCGKNGVFPKLKKNKWMHLECYIEYCVQKAIKDNLK